jgi:hypothetical protein
MDVGAIIAEQTIQLQQLHDKLGLPEGELSKDTTRIETAIKDAITSVVVSRANEVAEWETRIAQAKRDVLLLGRAVGDQSHGLAAATRRESEAVLSLPLQHQHVVQQWEGLEAVYRERLGKIEGELG